MYAHKVPLSLKKILGRISDRSVQTWMQCNTVLCMLTLGPTTAEKAVEVARSLYENQTSEKNVTETSIRALNDDTS